MRIFLVLLISLFAAPQILAGKRHGHSSARLSHRTCLKCKVCRTKPRTASYYKKKPTDATASQELYNATKMRAAVHKCEYKMKVGRCYLVTAEDSSVRMCYNGKSVIVRVNDNGPKVSPEGFDLTPSAFKILMKECPKGTVTRIPVVSREVSCPPGL